MTCLIDGLTTSTLLLYSTYRELSDLFMTLVSKDDYPTYYKMIKEPLSMEMILERIRSPYYRTIQQFRDDFRLMYDNARTFNEEGSFVYEDANTLQVKNDPFCHKMRRLI